MQRGQATLLDIERADRLVITFAKGLTKDAFLDDPKTQSAVLHQLLVIGEPVKRLSGGFRAAQLHIPWALVAGRRDMLIHAYDTVDLEEVWNMAVNDVPDLLINLEPLLPGKPE
jgi:uncharacterized protein with HEPN domain